ncbi:unnamed protein product [Leuciscus chuanchicus]
MDEMSSMRYGEIERKRDQGQIGCASMCMCPGSRAVTYAERFPGRRKTPYALPSEPYSRIPSKAHKKLSIFPLIVSDLNPVFFRVFSSPHASSIRAVIPFLLPPPSRTLSARAMHGMSAPWAGSPFPSGRQ